MVMTAKMTATAADARGAVLTDQPGCGSLRQPEGRGARLPEARFPAVTGGTGLGRRRKTKLQAPVSGQCPCGARARAPRWTRVLLASVLVSTLGWGLTQFPSSEGARASAPKSLNWTGLDPVTPRLWGDTKNWSPSEVPTANDLVTIGTGAPIVPLATTVLALTISAGATVSGGQLTTGLFNWTGGEIQNSVTVPFGGVAFISGSDPKTLSPLSGAGSGQLELGGISHFSGAGVLNITAGAAITNTGFFLAMPGTSMKADICCVVLGVFDNDGTFAVSNLVITKPGTVALNWVSFDDSGNVIVDQGSTLDLNVAPSNLNAGATFSGKGRTLFEGGAIANLTGTVTLGSGSTLEVGSSSTGSPGVLAGTGALIGSGRFVWSAGEVRARLSVLNPVATVIVGTNDKTLGADSGPQTGKLNLAGPTSFSGTGRLIFTAGIVLTNTGIFSTMPGTRMQASGCCNGQPAVFDNDGAFAVTNLTPPGTVVLNGVSFDDTGTVSVDKGSTLDLNNAPSNLNAGARFVGKGRTLFEGGAIATLTGTMALGLGSTLELGASPTGTPGVLAGTGTLSGSGRFVWSGGEVRANVSVLSTIATVIDGTNDKTLSAISGPLAGRLNLAGPTSFSGTGRLVFTPGAVLINRGVSTFSQGMTLTYTSCCVNPARFRNQGLLVNNVGAATTSFTGVELDNTGVVVLLSGTLATQLTPYNQTLGVTLLSGGSLNSSQPLVIGGGLVMGHGTITAEVTNSGGVKPLSLGGTLGIVGGFTEPMSGTLFVTIGGTTAGNGFSQLNVSRAVGVGGTLSIAKPRGFVPALGQSFTILTGASRSGQFATVTGSTIGAGHSFRVIYNATSVALVVVHSPVLSLKPSSGHRGTAAQVNASGYAPGETIRLSFTDARTKRITFLGNATADSNGHVVIRVIIPRSASKGSAGVTAVGATSGLTAWQSFTVK
jgi:hypothetical protein